MTKLTETTLLEPVPPPSPYWGCSEGRILPLPHHSLHRRRLRWVHLATSYFDGSSGKRRGSRCLMCAGPEQQRKTARFRAGLGSFRKFPLPSFLRPICPLWRPRPGTPSSGIPAYLIPSPRDSYNHTLQPPPPISSPTPGLWPAVGHRRHPPLLYPGLFQAPPPLHPGTGASSTPRPPSPISGKPAASEPHAPIQSLPVTYR